MKKSGCAVLLPPMTWDEAAQLCDRMAVIAAGRIVAEGTAGRFDRRIGAPTRWKT